MESTLNPLLNNNRPPDPNISPGSENFENLANSENFHTPPSAPISGTMPPPPSSQSIRDIRKQLRQKEGLKVEKVARKRKSSSKKTPYTAGAARKDKRTKSVTDSAAESGDDLLDSRSEFNESEMHKSDVEMEKSENAKADETFATNMNATPSNDSKVENASDFIKRMLDEKLKKSADDQAKGTTINADGTTSQADGTADNAGDKQGFSFATNYEKVNDFVKASNVWFDENGCMHASVGVDDKNDNATVRNNYVIIIHLQ